MTYQLGKPIPWDEFKQMPVHIQKEFISDMIQKYQTTASDLARLFGVTASTVTKHCSGSELDIRFSPGKRMPTDRRQEFEKLFTGEDAAEKVKEQHMQQSATVEQPVIQYMDMSRSKPASTDMMITDFSMCFQGDISPERVANSIFAMLQPGSKVRLEVKCSVLA